MGLAIYKPKQVFGKITGGNKTSRFFYDLETPSLALTKIEIAEYRFYS